MLTQSFDQLPSQIQQELLQAQAASKNQYPQTQDNHIGAVLVSGDKIITGAGVKRRRFNSGTCAERLVIDIALTSGICPIDRIIIYGANDTHAFTEVVSPCGACRQIIFEAMQTCGQTSLPVIMSNQDLTKVVTADITELLPLVYTNSKNP